MSAVPADAQIPPDLALAPFRVLESLDLPCRYERSFKLAPGRLYTQRYMLAVDIALSGPSRLLEACERLGMPPDCLQDFAARLGAARAVLFGFDVDADGARFKAYLEYPEPSRPADPFPIHTGFKWRARQPEVWGVTDYVAHPLIDEAGLLARLDALRMLAVDAPWYRPARSIIAQVAAVAPLPALRYLEASERGGRRRSFDINLYGAAMTVGRVALALNDAGRAFGIDATLFSRLMALLRPCLLGHLSAGIDRGGEPVFTVYFEPRDES